MLHELISACLALVSFFTVWSRCQLAKAADVKFPRRNNGKKRFIFRLESIISLKADANQHLILTKLQTMWKITDSFLKKIWWICRWIIVDGHYSSVVFSWPERAVCINRACIGVLQHDDTLLPAPAEKPIVDCPNVLLKLKIYFNLYLQTYLQTPPNRVTKEAFSICWDLS